MQPTIDHDEWRRAAARRALRSLTVESELPNRWLDLLEQMHGQPSLANERDVVFRTDEVPDRH